MNVLFILLLSFTHPADAAQFWRNIFSNWIADDPYEFENVSIDKLVWYYYECKNQRMTRPPTLILEITKRLNGELSCEDRIVLLSVLANERLK